MVNTKTLTEIDAQCKKYGATLVAVTKNRNIDELKELYTLNYKIFGENRVQELLGKKDELPADIAWHLIGHLQRNKVKYIVPFISMIQSVDSFKLLKEINKEANKVNRVIPCLLQFHIAQEESKFGFSSNKTDAIAQEIIATEYPNIQIKGVMGMASISNNKKQIQNEFNQLKNIYNTLKTYFNYAKFDTISMGMSGDYTIALNCGSNLIRVGSALFM